MHSSSSEVLRKLGALENVSKDAILEILSQIPVSGSLLLTAAEPNSPELLGERS